MNTKGSRRRFNALNVARRKRSVKRNARARLDLDEGQAEIEGQERGEEGSETEADAGSPLDGWTVADERFAARAGSRAARSSR